MKLKDRVVIITGAAHGIGEAYTRRCAREGAAVLLADIDGEAGRRLAEELQAAGGKAAAERVDVSSPEDTRRMAEVAVKRFGRIDALVCNAGIYPLTEWEKITLDDWHRVLNVNLTGTFLCCKAVVPRMKEQRRGSIVTIASSTFWSGSPRLAHYIASKGGVIGLTRAMATEFGPYGITVNCVAPGLTQTATVRNAYAEEWFQKRIDEQCIKRKQMPEDLTGAIVFLCSEDAAFVTGQCLQVNGGMSFH